MRDINLAILGFGFMGRVYAYAASSLKHFYPNAPHINIENVLVSKNTEPNCLLSRYRFNNVTNNFDEILNDSSIDAVYVALPNNLHLNHVAPAIESGKHVLCEKPLEINLEKTSEMLLSANNNLSIVTQSVFEYRFLPAVSYIKKLIDEQRLGKVLQFRICYLHGSYAEERPMSWRLTEGIGGALLDLGPHIIDLALYLLGPIKTVDGRLSAKYPSRGVDDIARILCETENGADGYIEASRLSVGSIDELRIEIHGDQGAVKWNLESMNFVHHYDKKSSPSGYKIIPVFKNFEDGSDFPPEKVSSDWLRPHLNCLYSFARSIADETFFDQRCATFTDGFNAQKIIEEIVQENIK